MAANVFLPFTLINGQTVRPFVMHPITVLLGRRTAINDAKHQMLSVHKTYWIHSLQFSLWRHKGRNRHAGISCNRNWYDALLNSEQIK